MGICLHEATPCSRQRVCNFHAPLKNLIGGFYDGPGAPMTKCHRAVLLVAAVCRA
jgi:hypothetical protein